MTHTLPVTKVAFEGLRLVRRHPRVILVWAGVNLAIGLTMNSIMITTFGDSLGALEEAALRGSTPGRFSMGAIAGFLLIALSSALVVVSIFTCAVYRMSLKPTESRFAYLRLAGDELRLVALSIILMVLPSVLMLGVVFIAAVLAFFAYYLAGPAAGLIGLLLLLTPIGLLAYLTVRFSLAGPMTFIERRVVIMGSWRLTQHSFWRLLGAYLLAFALALVVTVVVTMVFALVAAAVAGALTGSGRAPTLDRPDLSAVLRPVVFGYLLVASVIQAVFLITIFAPGAAAYKALADERRYA